MDYLYWTQGDPQSDGEMYLMRYFDHGLSNGWVYGLITAFRDCYFDCNKVLGYYEDLHNDVEFLGPLPIEPDDFGMINLS